MGGTIAALYSIEHKDKVKSVAFIGAPHGIKTHGLSEMDIHLNNGRFPLVPKSEKEFDNMMNLLFNKQPFIPSPILKHSKAQAIAQSGDNLRIFNQQFKERYLLHSKLPEVSVPIFALWGEHERIFHPDGATNIKGISKAKIIVKMIDTGHLPQMESPTESAELYKLFLRN